MARGMNDGTNPGIDPPPGRRRNQPARGVVHRKLCDCLGTEDPSDCVPEIGRYNIWWSVAASTGWMVRRILPATIRPEKARHPIAPDAAGQGG